MAQAHMKSNGYGVYTPKKDGYAQHQAENGKLHWHKQETEDEFSFWSQNNNHIKHLNSIMYTYDT